MGDQRRIDFEELKARADFRAVLDHYGLKVVGRREQAKIHCPFHDDERPSCSVNLERGLFHCFSCNEAGNVLDFVFRLENREGAKASLRQAGLALADICGIDLPDREDRRARQGGEATREQGVRRSPSRARVPRPKAPAGAGDGATAGETSKRNKPLGFELNLDPGHPYLKERGLTPELAAAFGLGLCRKGTMAGRIAIPIHDPEGRLVAYAGRWVGPLEELPEGKDKYELPGGFRKALELFNLNRVKSCRHLVAVEGFFGAIRLHGRRTPAVGLMGSHLSEEQVALLREHCPNLTHVTVMLDGDEPGRTAAIAVAGRLAEHWWVRKAMLPDGAQPDTVGEADLARLLRREHVR
jgi:DNA primase